MCMAQLTPQLLTISCSNESSLDLPSWFYLSGTGFPVVPDKGPLNGCSSSMSKVMKSFTCRGCLNPVTNTGCTSVDIGASANLELVDKFCYLGDMLSVDGDADAAV